MTLVELLAGLALMGSVLTGLLVARQRCLIQWRQANLRIDTCLAADQLLASCWQQPQSLPRAGSGTTGAQRQYTWTTQRVPNAEVELLGGRVIRLEVAGSGAAAPRVIVDVVVPAERNGP